MEKGEIYFKEIIRLPQRLEHRLTVLRCGGWLKNVCMKWSVKADGYFTDICWWKTIKTLLFHLRKLVCTSALLHCYVRGEKKKNPEKPHLQSSEGKFTCKRVHWDLFSQWDGNSLNDALGYARYFTNLPLDLLQILDQLDFCDWSSGQEESSGSHLLWVLQGFHYGLPQHSGTQVRILLSRWVKHWMAKNFSKSSGGQPRWSEAQAHALWGQAEGTGIFSMKKAQMGINNH